MGYYYTWGIRYPRFLKILKSMFLDNIDFGQPEYIQVFKTQKGKTERLETTHLSTFVEGYTKVSCDLPDGAYQVENAYNEDGNPFFITLKDGSFIDRDVAVAGAYMWWCKQSNNPTGLRTIHLNCFENTYCYHEGMCGELYHVHDAVGVIEFDIDKKKVSLKTHNSAV